ncbi:MAG: hypothetical protein Q9170_004377 [Blastenia crenularia]
MSASNGSNSCIIGYSEVLPHPELRACLRLSDVPLIMVQRQQQIFRISYRLSKTNKSSTYPLLPKGSPRAAVIDITSENGQESASESRANPQQASPSGSKDLPRIRKIIEPKIIDNLRTIQGNRYKTSRTVVPADREALEVHSIDWEKSFLRYRPSHMIRREDKRAAIQYAYRDIYFIPPDGAEAIAIGPTVKYATKYPSVYWLRKSKVPTVPHKTAALRRSSKEQSPFAGQQQRTTFSTSSIRSSSARTPSPAPIDVDQYHQLADTYIDNLVAQLEKMQEEREDLDCEYNAGVLTLAFPPAGTYILNKQIPNKQIWLSSPISGPKRYDYVVTDPPETDGASAGGDGASRAGVTVVQPESRGGWVYLRDGSTLSELLREELGVEVDEESGG